MNINNTPVLIYVWEDNEYCHVVPIADPIYGHLYDAHNPHYTVIVISLGTRAVTIIWST